MFMISRYLYYYSIGITYFVVTIYLLITNNNNNKCQFFYSTYVNISFSVNIKHRCFFSNISNNCLKNVGT